MSRAAVVLVLVVAASPRPSAERSQFLDATVERLVQSPRFEGHGRPCSGSCPAGLECMRPADFSEQTVCLQRCGPGWLFDCPSHVQCIVWQSHGPSNVCALEEASR